MGADGSGDQVWYADPIDGTTNFAHGHPFWCVSIGLVERGIPIVGAIAAPALGLEWLGWKGGPALRNGEPSHVIVTETIQGALLATGFLYDRHTSSDDNLEAFGIASSMKTLSQTDVASFSWGEGALANGKDDDRWVTIEVRHMTGTCDTTKAWQLTVKGN